MSHANLYNPNADFSEDAQAGTPARSLIDAVALDDELTAISQTTNQIIANQKLLQRDDGKLGDTVVEIHTLSREVLMLLGGYRLREEWTVSTQYSVSDVVVNNGYLYVCKTAHLSPSTFSEQPNFIKFGFAGSIEAGIAAGLAQAAANAAAAAATNAQTYANNANQYKTTAQAALNDAQNAKTDAQAALAEASAASASAVAAKDYILNSLGNNENSKGDALIAVKNTASLLDRTQHEKNMDLVTIADFTNSKGEQSNDQTAAVQSAINAAHNQGSVFVNDTHRYRVSENLTFPTDLKQIRVAVEHIAKKIDSAKNVIFIGDSLTEMRNSDSYLLHVVDWLANRNGGYKQVGYIPLSSYHTKDFTGFAISRSASMTPMWGSELTGGTWDLSPYTHSPDGKGMFKTTGSGADYVAIDFSKPIKYTKLRLHYLEQVGGGTFDLAYQYTPTPSFQNVNTAGAANVLRSIDFVAHSEESMNIRIKNITGKVALYGVELLNENGAGFTYTDFSRNGILLQDFLKLNATSTQAYFASILPDLVLLNIGTNDSNAGVTPAQFKLDMKAYIARIKAGSPACEVVLIEPNQPKGYFSTATLYSEYSAIRKEVAIELDIGYCHLPSAIGSYGEIAGKSAMEDTVHPNQKGKKIIGQAVIDYLDSVIQQSDAAYPVDTASYINKASLTDTSKVETTAAGTPRLVKKIGLSGNGNISASLCVEIQMIAYGQMVTKQSVAYVGRASTLARGKASFVYGLTTTTKLIGAGSGTPDFSVTMSINASNELEIYATPSGFSPTAWSIIGYATSSAQYLGGRFLVELS